MTATTLSPVARYATAARYTLLEQARNRLALGLLLVFVPLWYALADLLTTPGEAVDFKLRAGGTLLHVSARHLALLTQGLGALTLIVGFMLYSATRKGTAFDRRLVLCGYPQALLILAKLTAVAVVALLLSLYTSAVLALFWQPGHPLAWLQVWLGFLLAALTYGSLGLLVGVLVHNELAGFFLIIMLSLIDTQIQNPLGNPVASGPLVTRFPAYAATQLAVAGGFTHAFPLRTLLLGLAWLLALALLGLVVFWWRTRARTGRAVPLPGVPGAIPVPSEARQGG